MEYSTKIDIHPAEEENTLAVKELFVNAYGEDYPFAQFYDTLWLKKAILEDDTVFLVAREQDQVIGSISAMLTAGKLSDLIGEIGRLIVAPSARGKKIGAQLFKAVIDQISPIIQFGFAEARTAHAASQKILEQHGFVALGFEPHKYKLQDRESMVFYGRLFNQKPELRRNHPRLISEIAPLASAALERIGLSSDIIVVDEEDGYPMTDHSGFVSSENIEIEELSEQGWSPLLRIERGRVKGREVFGNLSLTHGFFKIKTGSTRYLVARQKGMVVGGLGMTWDPIDLKVRIFELIGINDSVKGSLLNRAEKFACEDLNAVYIEADVNAYRPAIQRTLERMGFMTTAYCPSMVFENVERLDVVRMAKLTAPYFREEIPLTQSAAEIRDIVERSMADRREGALVAQAAKSTDLFQGLDGGDIYHLARLGHLKHLKIAEPLVRMGELGDRIYILISGALQVLIDQKEVGRITPGETVGEIALLDAYPRSADVIALEASDVVEMLRSDLLQLIDSRGRLGTIVMRNLAADLADKLRKVDDRYIDAN